MRLQDIQTSRVAKFLSFQTISDPEVGWIGTTTTACQCHVHMWSNEMYCSACLDTQTFELAVTGKNFPSEQFCIRSVFDLQDYDNMSVLYNCHGRSIVSWGLMGHPYVRTWLWAKNLSCWKFSIRGVFDLQDYDTLSTPCEFAVPCCESGGPWSDPQSFELAVTEKNFFRTISDREMGPISTITTTGQCYVSVMSDPLYLEAWCDTQAFELANFVLLNNFVFGMCSICKTATACQPHVPVWSNEMYCFACLDTQAFELAVLEKICFDSVGVSAEGPIGTTTAIDQCHAHEQSHRKYWGPLWDSKTFELAVTEKNFWGWQKCTHDARTHGSFIWPPKPV